MGRPGDARLSSGSAGPVAGWPARQRRRRRIHVQRLPGLPRRVTIPRQAAPDRQRDPARLADRRIPVPRAVPRDVLRRRLPHAHPAGAPAALRAERSVEDRGVRAAAGGERALQVRALAVGAVDRARGRFDLFPRTPGDPAADLALHAEPAGRRHAGHRRPGRRARAAGHAGQRAARAGGDTSKPHPIFSDREVRRALSMAVDRASLVKSALGDLGKVPPGPMSSLLWIWDPEIRQLPYDTAQAGRILSARGWRDHDGDGVRDKNGQPLSFHILVPTTSVLRRQYARLLQEQFRMIGVRAEIDELEFSVVTQRLQSGNYDTSILSRGNDPSPGSGITQSWTRAGFGGSNFGRYYSAEFE